MQTKITNDRLGCQVLYNCPEKHAKDARKEQLRRLDLMRIRLYARLADPQVKNKEDIVRTLLKVEGREARLLGLDAPTKVEQTNLEDPDVAAGRDRQMNILGKLSLEERQEFLRIIQESKKDKGSPDGDDCPGPER
jgi:hypothetical protein